MECVQPVVFMLVGIIAASLFFKVLQEMINSSNYKQTRRALLDDRQEQLKQALGKKATEGEVQHDVMP